MKNRAVNLQTFEEQADTINELPDEYRRMVSGWKKYITGRFMLERYLKKGRFLFQSIQKKSTWSTVFKEIYRNAKQNEMIRFAL